MMTVEIGLDIIEIWVYHKVTVYTPNPLYIHTGIIKKRCCDDLKHTTSVRMLRAYIFFNAYICCRSGIYPTLTSTQVYWSEPQVTEKGVLIWKCSDIWFL